MNISVCWNRQCVPTEMFMRGCSVPPFQPGFCGDVSGMTTCLQCASGTYTDITQQATCTNLPGMLRNCETCSSQSRLELHITVLLAHEQALSILSSEVSAVPAEAVQAKSASKITSCSAGLAYMFYCDFGAPCDLLPGWAHVVFLSIVFGKTVSWALASHVLVGACSSSFLCCTPVARSLMTKCLSEGPTRSDPRITLGLGTSLPKVTAQGC